MTTRKSTKKSESSRKKYYISYSPSVMYRSPEIMIKKRGYTSFVPYAVPRSYTVGDFSKHQRDLLTKGEVYSAGYRGELYDSDYNPIRYDWDEAHKYRVHDIPISEHAYNRAHDNAYKKAVKKSEMLKKEFPRAMDNIYGEEIYREFGDLARRKIRARLRKNKRTSLRR